MTQRRASDSRASLEAQGGSRDCAGLAQCAVWLAGLRLERAGLIFKKGVALKGCSRDAGDVPIAHSHIGSNQITSHCRAAVMPNAGALKPASTSLQPVEEDEAITLPGGHSALQTNTENAGSTEQSDGRQKTTKEQLIGNAGQREQGGQQTDHFGEAMLGWKRPGVQAKQRSDRDTFANEPAGQGAQRDEAATATA